MNAKVERIVDARIFAFPRINVVIMVNPFWQMRIFRKSPGARFPGSTCTLVVEKVLEILMQ